MYNKKDDRITQVVDILRKRNGASVKELALELNVSEMTIHRDLKLLCNNNIVSLVHGAAIFNSTSLQEGSAVDYHVAIEKSVNNSEKEQIGRIAACMIEPNDVIIIDIGTTTERLAKYIPQNYSITVLCFTMNTLMQVFKKNVDCLILGGGYYHADTQLFESVETIELIRRTRATKLFLSAAGVSRELGLTCINQYEVNIKQACMDSSLHKILMVDSKKFGQIRPAYFSSLEKIDTVITDSFIKEEWVDILNSMGIDLQIV